MGATKKATKNVAIIARYAHKASGKLNGIVTYAVRSSNGKGIYCTTLIEGKASGCSCPAHKPCYHMTQLETRELERKAAEVVAIVEEAPVVEMPTQEVVVATPVAVVEYRMSDAVREKLAATAKPVVEPVAERKQYYSPNMCCNIWADTREPVEGQVVDGKIWGGKELGWVTPPSDEPIDHQAELAASGWRSAGRQIKDRGKAAMLVEIAEIRERSMMNAALTSNKPFSVLR